MSKCEHADDDSNLEMWVRNDHRNNRKIPVVRCMKCGAVWTDE